MVYVPNNKRAIDVWIIEGEELFDDSSIHNCSPIGSMPPVQQTVLFVSIEEDNTNFVNEIKRLVIHAALSEIVGANDRCGIPNIEQLEDAIKYNPLN